VPYWTFDIGGFTPEDHYRYSSDGAVGHFSEMPAEFQDEWQELNLRWFQLGAFTPLFRSHGQNAYREFFNLADEGSPVYESLVGYTELRYRLIPYIYTLAGDSYHRDSTIDASAPLARIPIHARAGAIIPTGPAIQHTGESLNAPLRLNIFTGADGRFDIYEDDGLTYGYENGGWSRIPVSYDDASGTVTLGERSGTFDGMAATRTISVRWIDGAEGSVSDFDSEADAVMTYDGDELRIEQPGR